MIIKFFQWPNRLVGICALLLSGCSAFSGVPTSPLNSDAAHQSVAPTESRFLPGPQPKLPDPPLSVTPEVRQQLGLYLRGNAACIKASIERRDAYPTMFAQIFSDEGIPTDMLNLAVVESHFDISARSPTGAVGIWQFTRSTAKLYGLRVERGVDERKDPVLSTIAAARHLRDLYRIFQDWYLVLAAYNAGPGAVMRAMQRTGGDTFWEIARRGVLSSQTRNFVPRFIAATILVRAADENGPDNISASVEAQLAKLAVTSGSSSVAGPVAPGASRLRG